MATITQQLEQLQTDKETLVTKLNKKGVEASNNETFTQLVPKVGDIQSGGDISEYFTENISYATDSSGNGAWMYAIKKLPPFHFNGTNASSLFRKCKAEYLDLSNIDTSKATTIREMLGQCENLILVDLSPLNTSNVTDMAYLFSGCKNLISVDLSPLDTSNVTNMNSMLRDCENLISIDLSPLDTSNVTDMGNMLYGCTALENLNLNNLDTPNVKNMSNMVAYCKNLISIDLSPLNTSNVINTALMLYQCTALKKLIINNSNIFPMTNTNMLSGTPIASGTGYVYVPDDLVESYKTATNWSVYASQIKPLSELPEEV